MNNMTRIGRVLWLLFLAFSVGYSVWSVWQLFTDTNRVVSALITTVVALAVARPIVTNLVWAISLMFWKPHKCVDSLYEWLQSPQVTEEAETSLLHTGSSARELLEHVVQVGAPASCWSTLCRWERPLIGKLRRELWNSFPLMVNHPTFSKLVTRRLL